MTAAELIEAARLERRYLEIAQGILPERPTAPLQEIALRKINTVRNPLYRMLLERRGIYTEPWEKLTAELHYSDRQLRRLYCAALVQLQYVLKIYPIK